MAKDDDKYKEGVDFEWVQGNNDENSGFKTRRFFTKAEKEAMKAPKEAAPKAAAPKAKPKAAAPKAPPKRPNAPAKSTSAVRPTGGGTPSGMPAKKFVITGTSKSGGLRPATGSSGEKKSDGSKIPLLAVGAAAAGAGKASPKLLPSPPKALPAPPKALPAPAKMIGKDAPKAESKPQPKPKPKAAVRKTISPKIAPPQPSAPKSQNSRGGGRSGGGGTMMGGDPMFRALGGGGFGSLEDLGREALLNMNKGGVVKMKEGSAKDTREDKFKAKKAGMSMKTWEKSAADKKHDAPKKMATGGVVKKAGGGSMRGTGAAVRGKGFSGCY